MKKQLLLIFSTASLGLLAQIPNPGFEQTTTTSGICNTGGASMTAPTNYLTSPNPNASTTIAHSGSKAALIASYNNQPEVLETFDCNTFQPFFTYTGAIPTAMTAWVRRAAAITNDTLTFTVQIEDTGNFPVAGGGLTITGAGYTSYTQVNIPIALIGGSPAKGIIGINGSYASNSIWYVDDLAFVTVGIQTYGKDNFQVYYNVSGNSIEIKSATDEQVTLLVYDMVGKKVTEVPQVKLDHDKSVSVSAQGLQPGVYLLQLQDGSGIISTKRILIQ